MSVCMLLLLLLLLLLLCVTVCACQCGNVCECVCAAVCREEIVRRLRAGELWILITTDLLARGMDFKGIKLVVNYDFPQVATTSP